MCAKSCSRYNGVVLEDYALPRRPLGGKSDESRGGFSHSFYSLALTEREVMHPMVFGLARVISHKPMQKFP